jgi:hypothetical protein
VSLRGLCAAAARASSVSDVSRCGSAGCYCLLLAGAGIFPLPAKEPEHFYIASVCSRLPFLAAGHGPHGQLAGVGVFATLRAVATGLGLQVLSWAEAGNERRHGIGGSKPVPGLYGQPRSGHGRWLFCRSRGPWSITGKAKRLNLNGARVLLNDSWSARRDHLHVGPVPGPFSLCSVRPPGGTVSSSVLSPFLAAPTFFIQRNAMQRNGSRVCRRQRPIWRKGRIFGALKRALRGQRAVDPCHPACSLGPPSGGQAHTTVQLQRAAAAGRHDQPGLGQGATVTDWQPDGPKQERLLLQVAPAWPPRVHELNACARSRVVACKVSDALAAVEGVGLALMMALIVVAGCGSCATRVIIGRGAAQAGIMCRGPASCSHVRRPHTRAPRRWHHCGGGGGGGGPEPGARW